VPGKDLDVTLWWSFPGAAKKKQNKAASGEEKTGTFKMKFTGTLIEDLMATVERAEQKAQAVEALAVEPLLVETSSVETSFGESVFAETSLAESALAEPWFASVQENADYDSKLFGVA
jgi:hypothetical protein